MGRGMISGREEGRGRQVDVLETDGRAWVGDSRGEGETEAGTSRGGRAETTGAEEGDDGCVPDKHTMEKW